MRSSLIPTSILISLACAFSAGAQTAILPSTTVTLLSGTTLSIPDGSDLLLNANVDFVNDGTILLNGNASLLETSSFPIYGMGTEVSRSFQNAPLNNLDAGGLGLSLSNSIASDSLQITRGHIAEFDNNGTAGILRWYNAQADNWDTGGSIALTYDLNELNGINQALVDIFRNTSGSNWISLIGVSSGNTISAASDSLGLFTVFEDPSLSLQELEVTSPGLEVYPNPTSEILYVKTGQSGSKIFMYNASGTLVKTITVTPYALQTIDVSALPTGLYELRTSNGQESRIIKQ